MVSLIFGILALACTVASYFPAVSQPAPFLPWIGFLFAIVAVATGGKVLRIDSNDKNARAGKTIGTICIVLAILSIVFYFVIAAGLFACVGLLV